MGSFRAASRLASSAQSTYSYTSSEANQNLDSLPVVAFQNENKGQGVVHRGQGFKVGLASSAEHFTCPVGPKMDRRDDQALVVQDL